MRKGLTLIESLVASITLVLIVTSCAVTFYTVRKLSRRIYYRYTAINLARDVMEFGEAARYTNGFTIVYQYSAADAAYRVTSTAGSPPAQNPFDFIGDIKARGMVPVEAPDSVVISYDVANDANFWNELVQRVKVTWKEDPADPDQKVTLGVLPIRQVNDQLQLRVQELLWN